MHIQRPRNLRVGASLPPTSWYIIQGLETWSLELLGLIPERPRVRGRRKRASSVVIISSTWQYIKNACLRWPLAEDDFILDTDGEKNGGDAEGKAEKPWTIDIHVNAIRAERARLRCLDDAVVGKLIFPLGTAKDYSGTQSERECRCIFHRGPLVSFCRNLLQMT